MDCTLDSTKKICAGIYFKERMEAVFPLIKVLTGTGLEKNYQLIVTGYSFGGASANIFLYLAITRDLVSR